MSNTSKTVELECSASGACEAIDTVLTPRDKDLGGFSVRRSLPTVQRKMVGPWIFFDHMGPADFTAGEGINVRPHPHIGLATVTYLFEGEILHRDSLGSVQLINPGDINLMVAGRGIVHSERQTPEVTSRIHRVHGLQLWLALPEDQEEIDPAFYHYSETDIPALEIEGVSVRVMMGSAYGLCSPVRVFADTLYLEANLQAGQALLLPDAEERAVYVVDGSLTLCNTRLDKHSMAVLIEQQGVRIEALKTSRIVVIGGEKFEHRFVEWNFVSSRKSLIEQAKDDWRCGRFSKVPGDESEYIPLPD